MREVSALEDARPPEKDDARAGRYRVQNVLGRGGMGLVYRAWDEVLEREVALRVLRPALLRRRGTRDRLVRESKAMAQLRHPNVGMCTFAGSNRPLRCGAAACSASIRIQPLRIRSPPDPLP